MIDADERRELSFEGVDMGTERGHPVAVEGIEEQLAFPCTHVGWREVDARNIGGHGAARYRPRPCESWLPGEPVS